MPKRLTETQIERLLELVKDRSAKTADDDLIRWAIDRSPTYVLADALRNAYQELDQLQEAVKKVVSQRADNLCWRDVYTELAGLLGFEFTPELICDQEKFLANCKHFDESLRTGGSYIPVYVERKSPGIFATLSAQYNSWTLHKVSKTTFTPDLQRGETGKYDPLFRFAEHLQKAKEKGTLYRCRINKGKFYYGTSPGMAAAAAIQAEKEKENEQKQVESPAGGGAVYGQGGAGGSEQADDTQRGGENPASQTDL